ncbi:UNVERIFIED_CONTAM: hypothetical protein Sradi_6243900 [Sesamum radiatum]|uniref:Uncharacterized protein n=1 Tax=Sesamum radiatum TaxID=300843 RepID=A0AAW2KD20_SESRA
MCHSSTTQEWRHSNQMYLDFTVEPRNVRLGLCTDLFVPHGQYGRAYSYWPVILVAYNLPLKMCMSSEYMFLKILTPDSSDPQCQCVPRVVDRGVAQFVACGCTDARCHEPGIHDAHCIDVDHEWPTRFWHGGWMEYR